MARRGDADIVFVHDQAAEEKFVAEGFGLKRQSVMYNDFVARSARRPIPPLCVAQRRDVTAALQRLAGSVASRLCRGRQERHACGRTALLEGRRHRHQRRQAHGLQGMRLWHGPRHCNMASATNAYVLADRGTWLSFKNRGELDRAGRRRPPSVQSVWRDRRQPGRHPHVKSALAQQFADWLVSPAGQGVIASYRIGGEQLFFPSAGAVTTRPAGTRRVAPAAQRRAERCIGTNLLQPPRRLRSARRTTRRRPSRPSATEPCSWRSTSSALASLMLRSTPAPCDPVSRTCQPSAPGSTIARWNSVRPGRLRIAVVQRACSTGSGCGAAPCSCSSASRQKA